MKLIPLDAFKDPPRLQDLIHRVQKRKRTEDLHPNKKETRTLNIQERVSFIAKDASLFHKDWIHIQQVTKEPTKEEFSFVDSSILQQLRATKKKIHELTKEQLQRARERANPCERIRNSRFMNRAAVKLANLDSLYQFSSCHTFLDLCGGPGGFVEYLLWKSKDVSGWGITLHGNQDYDLKGLRSFGDRFQAVYGPEETGDITVHANRNVLTEQVLKHHQHGVDLVLGDGAFSVEGDELHQEHHTKELLLCQILVMFKTLKKGGTFVVKLFDTVTPFTVSLIYLLYLHFEKLSMIKPLSSRPANAEKYLVCKNLQVHHPAELIAFLETVAQQCHHLKPQHKSPVSAHKAHPPSWIPFEEQVTLNLDDISTILDPSAILKDTTFADWMDDMNVK
jgi:23S rRNA U2552 (ribose-2'-O)-methylase RlmE/FtsJ